MLAMAGFIAVAVAQVTNMILARANAGEIPPFSLAFARWPSSRPASRRSPSTS
jgi:hypothetical protein